MQSKEFVGAVHAELSGYGYKGVVARFAGHSACWNVAALSATRPGFSDQAVYAINTTAPGDEYIHLVPRSDPLAPPETLHFSYGDLVLGKDFKNVTFSGEVIEPMK